MKLQKKCLLLILILFILTFSICLKSYAVNGATDEEYESYGFLYKKYLELSEEERAKVDTIPIKYDIPMEQYYGKYLKNNLINSIVGNLIVSNVGTNLPSSYILSSQDTNNDGVVDNKDIRVDQYGGLHLTIEDQTPYNLCWAFASLNTLETYLQLHGYGDYDYSELHLDYMDVIMERSKNSELVEERELHDGGNYLTFYEYMSHSDGPVLEEEVPYDASYSVSQDKEHLKSFQPRAEFVEDPLCLSLLKENGQAKIFNSNTGEYMPIDDNAVNSIRDEIKSKIMESGALYAVVNHNEMALSSTTGTYVVNGTNYTPDHGVTIVGWDDNFSRNNFPESIRPKNDGAYIVLNTWQGYSNGYYMYVSYEDTCIEAQLFAVNEARVINPWEIKLEGTPKTSYYVGEKFSTDGISIKAINQDGTKKDITGQCVITPNVLAANTHEVTITYTENNRTFSIKVPVEVTDSPYRVIEFKDNMMYEKVVSALGDKIFSSNPVNLSIQMTQEDIDSVEELNLQSFNGAEENVRISDISGIEKFTNLKKLYLYNNKIENIDKLENLKNLEILWISSNKIKKIDKLSGLTKLKDLDISYNEIESVKPIENLTELKSLTIQNNKIADISDLSKLTKLTSLLASNNEIENIDVISNFGLMDELQLEKNEIRDISPLHGLNHLRVLILGDNRISDLGGLPNTDTLVDIDLDNNRIDDISNLPSNINKDVLYLRNQKLSINYFGTEDEVDLPQLFSEVKDQTSPLYTDQEFTLSEGVSLINDGKKVKFENGIDIAEIKINGGRADGTVITIDRRSEIPMTDLYFDKTDIILALDEFDPQNVSNRRLKATYLPENTTSVFLTWFVEDRSIVNIEELTDESNDNHAYATLVPLKVGKTKVTLSADGTSLSAVCNVTVVASRSKILKDNSTYSIENGYLLGVKTRTSLEALKNNINETFTAKIKNVNGSQEILTGNVGTGMKVEVYRDGNLIETLTIVIKGDINGDGIANGPDAIRMLKHRKHKATLEGVEFMAADINGDGSVGGPDAIRLLKHRKNKTGYEL